MKNQAKQIGVHTMNNTRTIVMAALLAALTFVGTMIIRIPTPTMGYVHVGDAFVLMSGLLLGPLWGGLAAGFGSALTDLAGGYMVFVPGTFIIKGLTAVTAWAVFKALNKSFKKAPRLLILIISGIIGELVMVFGYFAYEIFILASDFTKSGLIAGLVASLAGIPANAIQAIFAVIILSVLYPMLHKNFRG